MHAPLPVFVGVEVEAYGITPAAAPEGIEIVVTRLDAEPQLTDRSAASLSPPERERAARFRHHRDRKRFILAHVTLRQLLAQRSALPPGSLEIEYGKYGKPALAHSDLQFSLSRRGEVAAYAFAHEWPIGIDIEAIRPVPEADAIAAQVFPRQELRAYAEASPRDKLSAFFRSWTRTEAIAKALGGGLSLPPASLDAELESRDEWLLHSFSPAPGFAGAVASRRTTPRR
jgi:4'-phosphopantetheinyl transferase